MNIMANVSAFKLSPLPYDEDALAPVISGKTMSFHYGKHHKGYVDKLNELVQNTRFAAMPLDEVVRESAKDSADHAVFNNAAQAWNHAFFWACLTPRAGQPSGKLKQDLERDFGSIDNFRDEFAKEGVAQFGSGWVWLVAGGGKLKIEKTVDAETPMAKGRRCILTIDVWEHAYYLDYQNRRADFLKAVCDKLLNWDFALQNYQRAG
jgi:superoxide dismutase, Fe-Mn family